MTNQFLLSAKWAVALLTAVTVVCGSCAKEEEEAFPEMFIRYTVTGVGTDTTLANRPMPGIRVEYDSYQSCFGPGATCDTSVWVLKRRNLVDGTTTASLKALKLKRGSSFHVTLFFHRPRLRPLTSTSAITAELLVDGKLVTGIPFSLTAQDQGPSGHYTSSSNTADLTASHSISIPKNFTPTK